MAGGGRQSRLGFSCAAAVAVFFLSLSCLALLADFRGGEDDNGTFAFSTISASVGGSGTFGRWCMPAITDNWHAAAASFRNNSARFVFQHGAVNIGGNTVFTIPLHSSQVDFACAVGLTGTGEVLAIVDAGFLQTHEAFAGKQIFISGSPSLDDHGTNVASVAAGDSSRMVGVAPGADFIVGNWKQSNFGNLDAAANAARARGAVAQNNSWGFCERSCRPDRI